MDFGPYPGKKAGGVALTTPLLVHAWRKYIEKRFDERGPSIELLHRLVQNKKIRKNGENMCGIKWADGRLDEEHK